MGERGGVWRGGDQGREQIRSEDSKGGMGRDRWERRDQRHVWRVGSEGTAGKGVEESLHPILFFLNPPLPYPPNLSSHCHLLPSPKAYP